MLRPRRFFITVAVALLATTTTAGRASVVDSGTTAIREETIEFLVDTPDGPQILDVTMYALAEPGVDMGARMEAGRDAMRARFPAARELTPAEVSAQFKLFPTAVRWPQPSTSWLYNGAGSTQSMPAADALLAVQAGSKGWDNAAGSGWHYDYLGETTNPTGCNGIPTSIPKDGVNVVGWGHIIGGFLGYSCHWHSPSLVEGTPYFALTEFDIILEPGVPYSAQTLQALAFHEFGHSLGLDHTEPSLCPGQAMCAGDDALRFIAPQKDDLFGIIALYGVAGPQVPPGSRPFRVIGVDVAKD
jgi:hypothetical protein